MAWLIETWSRVRGAFARRTMEREMDEEMRFHLERAVERNVARGLSPAAARREALLTFGGVDRFKEASREEHRSRPLEELWQDVTYGVRALRRAPLFAFVAIMSLAVGIGANTAVFSVVDAVLLKPLPYHEPERLVLLGVHSYTEDYGTTFSVADLEGFASARSFEAYGASYRDGSGIALTGGDQAETIMGTRVTPGVLETLDVAPMLGRLMLPEEGEPGSTRVVVLSHAFWRDRLGAADDAIGSTLVLDGQPHTVIGVMPADFQLPARGRDDLWPVLQLEPADYRAPFYLSVIARVAPDVTEAQVRGELASIERNVKEAYPQSPPTWSYRATPLKDVLVQNSRTTILVLFGAVGLVLLIAAANVANLLLARATTRAPEMAVRAALGAARGRIIRQLLTESMLVALAGAALGILIAYAGVAAFSALTPVDLARVHEVRVDYRVLLFTLGVSLLAGFAVGIAPALRAPRALAAGIREGGRSGAEGHERASLRGALVVVEFALALGVLIGAGLLATSLARLQRVDAGTAREGILSVRIALPEAQYSESADVARFYDGLVERMQRMPGVQAAAVSMAVPPHRLVMTNPFTPEGRIYGPQDAIPLTEMQLVSPRYFEALGIPLTRGRTFGPEDRDGAPLVAIVNRTMVDRHYGGRDPIGRLLDLGNPSPDGPRWTIVGVVPDVRYAGLDVPPEPTVYMPYAQNLWWRSMYLIVRAAGDPLTHVPAVRQAVAELDPNVPLREVRTMEQLLQESVAAPRFRTMLLGAFAIIALILAAAGIYGVMSYTVDQRRREISVRLALGARPSEIVRLVVGRGMLLAGVGVILGLAGAAALSTVLQTLLFDIDAIDARTYAAAASFLALIALLACVIPAMRAGGVEAASALRSD